MITEQEMQISNMSYTEKDFASIYPALLDLVKQLTNKWDPSISNESDPGNVLLKLLAAVGDKNNYNIDKNVLECFMPSATQETSMRMLTEAVGYNMKYYQSAMTDITFKYTQDMETPITFGRFSTVVSNQDNSVAYTLIEDVNLSTKNVAVSGLAIEGQLTDLTVGDSKIIKLDNLDDSNRLYFPELYVAENGVFITNDGFANFDEWVRVDNLNTQQPLKRCYKFGFDSQAEFPYIEFPTDIAQLLGSGIRVSYIVTTADAGNVSAGVLTTLMSSDVEDVDSEDLVIFNPSASANGRTKETIDEAYNNFKRIVGTFDTLVTTRDYANAMYNLADQYNEPIVSNAMAADRTNDINYGLQVVTYDQQGQYTELIPSDDLTATDLVLYPLKPYNGENYDIYNPSYVYDDSFEPLKTYKIQNGTEYLVDDDVLVGGLEEMKCIGHTFKDIPTTRSDDTDQELVYNFRNIARLDAQIYTYAKVNAIAQADIKANVLKALSDNFNARMVDYGYEIPYDKLLDVIYSADSRIKLVNLSEPEYVTETMFADGTKELVMESDGTVITDVIAKNVLAGKLSLFLYDDRFDWQFGQTEVDTYDNISSITTLLSVPAGSNTFNYTLDKNEALQFIAPTLNTTVIYPAGVYYRFTTTGTPDSGVIITANTDYKLQPTQSILLYYVDSNETEKRVTLGSGAIVRPTFDMRYTQNGSITLDNSLAYDKIATNKTLEVRDYVSVKLDNIGTPIYWIRNNKNNVLFESTDTIQDQTVILDANEYFIYSNSNLDDLVVLGAGTAITRVGDKEQWAINNTISLESINLNGVDAFKSGDWQYKQLTANKYLTLQEMQIVTVGEGATVDITNWTSHPANITSAWSAVNGEVVITSEDGSVQRLSNITNDTQGWKVRTRLDIDADPDTPQVLVTDSSKTQQFIVYLTSGAVEIINGTSDGNTRVLFNYPVMMAGGTNIDMKVTNVLLGTSSYSLSLCKYNFVAITSNDSAIQQSIDPATNINLALTKNFYVDLPISVEYIETEQPSQEELAQGANLAYNYQPFGTYIVPMLFTQGSRNATPANRTKIEISSDSVDVFNYNVYDNLGNKVSLTSAPITEGGLYNLEIVAKWLGSYGMLTDLQAARPQYAPVTLYEQPDGWPTGYYTNTSGTAATTFVAGTTYYVKPNQTNDICQVVGYTVLSSKPSDWDTAWFNYFEATTTTGPMGTTYNATYKQLTSATAPTSSPWPSNKYYKLDTNASNRYKLYKWNGSSWGVVSNSSASNYKIRFTITIDVNQETESFLTIGKIHKILDLNQAIATSMQGQLLLDRIAELTDGITNSDGEPVTFYYCYEPSNADVIETNSMISPEAFWDVNNVANKFTIPKLDLTNSNIYIARSSQL